MNQPPDIRSLIARATPGPWQAEPHPADRTINVYGPPPLQRHIAELSPFSKFGQMELDANAQLIARCSPDALRVVVAALELDEAVLKAVHAHRDCLPKDLAIAVKQRADLTTQAIQALNGHATANGQGEGK